VPSPHWRAGWPGRQREEERGRGREREGEREGEREAITGVPKVEVERKEGGERGRG
jgi:hypothetical protein